MTLGAGTKLGTFEILSPLGAGGMGEVYRAQDKKLGRDVAIKVLLQAFSKDAERAERFEREAKLLAALNHPGIATLYGLEEDNGQTFLVMELVEGETLAERISQEKIPTDEAIPLFIQIAEALEAAHEKGIIHRDLKPANIKVTPEGKVKILDFGLAKAFTANEDVSAETSQSPTLTKGTALGVIMGTAAYMSPEQARGKPVDMRTDIWAFGCCLFESLAGKKAFSGETVTDTLASILQKQPDLEALPDSTSPALRELVRRCLTKDARQRLQHVGEGRIALSDILGQKANLEPPRKAQPQKLSIARWLPAVLGSIAIVASATLWMTSGSVETPRAGWGEPVHLDLALPEGAPLALETRRPAIAVAPDGSMLAYVADRNGRRQLYVRRLDSEDAVPVEGTEDGHSPFFSPDGDKLGFVSRYFVMSVSPRGGPTKKEFLVPPVTRGVSWAKDDFALSTNPNGGIELGAALQEPLAKPDAAKGEFSHRWPDILPDSPQALITIDTGGDFDSARIGVIDLRDGSVKSLLDGGTNPRYVASGHLVFARAGSLWAVPFDLDGLTITGEPRRVVESVLTEPEGAAHFGVSRQGTLVYAPGGKWRSQRKLVWVDRDGNADPLPHAPRPYIQPRLSPDGRRLAVTIPEGSDYDVWMSSVDRGNLDPLTRHPGEDFNPLWTGEARIGFSSELHDGTIEAPPRIYEARADGSGEAKPLFELSPQIVQGASSWSSAKNLLAYFEIDLTSGITDGSLLDLWIVPLDSSAEPVPFERTEFEESEATFSPDGNWIAYVSDRSGRQEVYVRPYPGPGSREQVSIGGGSEPLWSPKGTEIFYRDGYRMMAVSVKIDASELTLGDPAVLFEGRYELMHRADTLRNYDVSPDGRRFLMVQSVREPVVTQLKVIINWFTELERLVPTDN